MRERGCGLTGRSQRVALSLVRAKLQRITPRSSNGKGAVRGLLGPPFFILFGEPPFVAAIARRVVPPPRQVLRKIRLHEAVIVVRVMVAAAVPERAHESGRSVAQVQRNGLV